MTLAEELHNLAIRQLTDGQADAGEATARQAIATYQQAVALPDPAIESIVGNLTTLDKQLNHAGDVANALAAQRAAVAILSIPDRDDADEALDGTKFREAVAPVYLRRNQEDVLSELPPRLET